MKNRKSLNLMRKHKHKRMTYRIKFDDGKYLKFVANAFQARDIIRGFIRTIDKESKVSKV